MLNLHCYQEEDQERNFGQIARAIDELDIDVGCFQEVAEHWNNGMGDWRSNSARIINEQLRRRHYLATDWSHLKLDRCREGVAVPSLLPAVQRLKSAGVRIGPGSCTARSITPFPTRPCTPSIASSTRRR